MDASDIWLFLTWSCHSFCLVLTLLLAIPFVELHLSSKTYFATFSLETSCSWNTRSAAWLLSSFPPLTHLGNKCLPVVCSRFSPFAWKTHLPAVCGGTSGRMKLIDTPWRSSVLAAEVAVSWFEMSEHAPSWKCCVVVAYNYSDDHAHFRKKVTCVWFTCSFVYLAWRFPTPPQQALNELIYRSRELQIYGIFLISLVMIHFYISWKQFCSHTNPEP